MLELNCLLKQKIKQQQTPNPRPFAASVQRRLLLFYFCFCQFGIHVWITAGGVSRSDAHTLHFVAKHYDFTHEAERASEATWLRRLFISSSVCAPLPLAQTSNPARHT